MPRTAQSNRTDLQIPATMTGPGQPNGQPVTTPTNLPYGEAGQLAQAQQAQPLPQAPTQPAPVGPQDAMSAAKNFQMPALPDLHGPSARPNEPVTMGLPSGPGAPPPQGDGIGAMLSRMASVANSPALAQLAARANSLQQ